MSATEWVNYDDFMSRDYEILGGVKFEQYINEYPDYWLLEEVVVLQHEGNIESFQLKKSAYFDSLDEAMRAADDWMVE